MKLEAEKEFQKIFDEQQPKPGQCPKSSPKKQDPYWFWFSKISFNLQTKEVVQELEYDDLGNQLKNTNPNFQPLGYAGGLYDVDTKLIRFGARDYDPTVGRWTTKDPIGFAGGDTNLYAT